MRLSPAALQALPAAAARFAYHRDAQAIGIVHFGIGAFHRAHQAWYTDLAMEAGDRDWAICGVSLRSPGVVGQLAPQSGLYSLTTRSAAGEATRVIGAVHEVLFAPEQREEVIARIASPACRIVSFTVTEKGYCRAETGGLDNALAEDSFYPLLAEALRLRMERGLPGVTLLSCDNLAENGRVLCALMQQWIAAHAPQLGTWFAEQCTTPSSMVDRIVPRSTPADLDAVEARLGMRDLGAVFTERFSQWVIEDRFAQGRPAWERHGAQMVDDVAPYESAKLRMLNGAHSLLAYGGLRAGHEFVHEAIADPALAAQARQLMLEEAAPSVAAAPGQDLAAYAEALVARFANPALGHRLAQIAIDGTQKIPQRWLDTAAWHAARGGDVPAIRAAFGSWLWHLEDARFVDDPQGEALAGAIARGGRAAVLDLCFGGGDVPALWPAHAALRPMFEGS